MWLTFKQELQHRTLQFIPTMHNTWKEEGWTLNAKLREYISKKHRLWTRYLETHDNAVLKKYKSVRNRIKMKLVNYKKRNNKMSLSIANKIERPSRSILIANVKLELTLVIYILWIFLVILPRSVQIKIKQKS